MRFKPSPSGPLHIGHAYVLALNSEYAKKYKGKMILWIDDTNPDNIYKEAYKLIQEDAKWLTKNNISKFLKQSDNIEEYYKYMNILLGKGKVYICTCDKDKYKNLISKCKACPCRELSKTAQKKRWEEMFTKFKMGEAVARLKTNLLDKNPAMRDFPIFRINETPHLVTKKKYKVWPLMNFAVAIDDLLTKSTHVIRAKDHADNAKRQAIIHDYLGHKTPETIFLGKINFLDMPVSSTKMMEGLKGKKYTGWDDPKLPTLLALRRRGFLPDSLVKYALDVGVSLTDKTVSKEEFFKSIETTNRRLIDRDAERFSFVENPIKLNIAKMPEINEIKVPIHPDKKETRKVKIGKILISEKDYHTLQGKEIRLLHLFNIHLKKKHVAEFTSQEVKPIPKINWVSEGYNCRILMPDGEIAKGKAEKAIKTLKNSKILQFERYGFAKFEKKRDDSYEFIFTHK